MRQELVLGSLVSVGLHLAVFMAPWTPAPKHEILGFPKPELEISFRPPAQREDHFRQQAPFSTDASTSQEKLEPLSSPQQNLEPPVFKKEKIPYPSNISKPKVKPLAEKRKQEAQAQESPLPKENIPRAHLPSDSSDETGALLSRGGEAQPLPAKGEKTTGPQEPPSGGQSPKAQLNKAFPRYESNPKPAYPEVARRRGYEGKVILSVVVMKDGSPGSVRVAKSSGYQVLDDAAMAAVAQWKFVPAHLGQEPVEMEVEVPIIFRLE